MTWIPNLCATNILSSLPESLNKKIGFGEWSDISNCLKSNSLSTQERKQSNAKSFFKINTTHSQFHKKEEKEKETDS